MITTQTTLRELAFIVGEQFIAAGARAVLTGGGAATVHSKEAYQSQDLDFVLVYRGRLAHVIESLGFEVQGAIYRHPQIVWTIEFIEDDLGIGEDYEIRPIRLEENGKRLDILSPTDSVRDRLAWYLNYTPPDYAALSQALHVARATQESLNFTEIRAWASTQTYPERLSLFMSSLGQEM